MRAEPEFRAGVWNIKLIAENVSDRAVLAQVSDFRGEKTLIASSYDCDTRSVTDVTLSWMKGSEVFR